VVADDLRGSGFRKEGESITMEKACEPALNVACEVDVDVGGRKEGELMTVATLDLGDLIAALGRRSITVGVIAEANFGEDRLSSDIGVGSCELGGDGKIAAGVGLSSCDRDSLNFDVFGL
jgi:hypothetical protein